MLGLVFAIIAAVSVFLPNWLNIALLLAWNVVQRAILPEPLLFAVGPLELRGIDLVLLVIFAKFALDVVLRREAVMHRGALLVLGSWMGVNLIASALAAVKFGPGHALSCVMSWARLVSEVVLVGVMAHSIRTPGQARACMIILVGTLAGLVGLQFFNFIGASRGFFIGEIQGIERGELRYFGPVGDSVGFVLLLGYVFALCRTNLPFAVAALGAILLTAGVGTILATLVATGLFLLFRPQIPAPSLWDLRKIWLLPLLLLGIGLAAAHSGSKVTATLVERFTTGGYQESGSQRKESALLALDMIADNPFAGVGFMGYRSALERYGGSRYFDLTEANNGATANANNQALQALADAGVPGLVATAILLIWIIRLLHRLTKRSDDPLVVCFLWASIIWLLAQIFGNLVATWLGPASFVTLILWIVLGIGLALDRLLPELKPVPPLAEPQPQPA